MSYSETQTWPCGQVFLFSRTCRFCRPQGSKIRFPQRRRRLVTLDRLCWNSSPAQASGPSSQGHNRSNQPSPANFHPPVSPRTKNFCLTTEMPSLYAEIVFARGKGRARFFASGAQSAAPLRKYNNPTQSTKNGIRWLSMI